MPSRPSRSAPSRSPARPRTPTGDIYVHAGANFKPVTIAVTPFAGEDAGDKDQRRRRHGFRPLDLPSAGQSDELSRDDRQSGRVAQHRRLEGGQRAIRLDRTRAASGRRARHGAIPAVGHGDRRAGRRPAVHDRCRERAPRRAHDRRRGVLARDRREGIFRFPRRLRRRERPEGEAAQAAGGHGHGRRQRQIPRRAAKISSSRRAFRLPPSRSPICRSAPAIPR